MTITAFFPVLQRPWRGYDDPGLPVGMYRAQGTVLGNATGGQSNVTFLFREEGEAVTGRFYNIEQMDAMKAVAFAQNGHLRSEGFETVGSTGLINFERRIRLELDTGNFGVSMEQHVGIGLPLFLGSAQALVGINAQVVVGVGNVDTETFAVSIQGYIWEPRSIMAEGGLRRPVDSLYGGGR